MPRESHDRVKCIRVFDNYYRCNWWTPSNSGPEERGFDWATGATHHVRKSAFLRATLDGEELVVEEVVRPAAQG